MVPGIIQRLKASA